MTTKFIRRTSNRYSKLGKGRKKKQVWRKPTGRDNKMRERRKGHAKVVSIGYKTSKKARGDLENKKPVIIMNIKDLDLIKDNKTAIIGKIGRRKKIEIANKAKELKISLNNINVKKFIENNKIKKKETKQVADKNKEKPKEEKK